MANKNRKRRLSGTTVAMREARTLYRTGEESEEAKREGRKQPSPVIRQRGRSRGAHISAPRSHSFQPFEAFASRLLHPRLICRLSRHNGAPAAHPATTPGRGHAVPPASGRACARQPPLRILVVVAPPALAPVCYLTAAHHGHLADMVARSFSRLRLSREHAPDLFECRLDVGRYCHVARVYIARKSQIIRIGIYSTHNVYQIHKHTTSAQISNIPERCRRSATRAVIS